MLGMPVDAVDMASALARIDEAAAGTKPFLVSTCNLNFLANSLSDPGFRESLLLSDLCTADGMPILWLARLLGVPVKERVAGSEIFEALGSRSPWRKQLAVFLFGGPHGVADAACRALNSHPGGLRGAGSMYPGYGLVEDLSSDAIIDAINSSHADFLTVALGPAKGQAWLRRNHDRVRIPVRAHLGAAVSFQAGAVKRAPRIVQKLCLEWLWRIKEEPHLWTRYFQDGCVLLRLLLTRVLPLAARMLWDHTRALRARRDLRIVTSHNQESIVLHLAGEAVERHIGSATAHFRDALVTGKQLVAVDISEVSAIDPRFLGLLLMVRKCVGRQGARLEIVGASPTVERLFRLNEAAFLLPAPGDAPC